MINFEDKTVLITGATGGIGEEIARAFHRAGASVVLSGTRESKLIEITQELGDRAYYQVCDLSSREQVKDLYSKAESFTGKIDVVICNAGITRDNLLLRMSEEDFEEVININLMSSFLINKAAVKKMLKQQWGRIINISSIIGVTGNAGQANYAASKAGIIAMTKSIAQEVAVRGITVNAIAPGFIVTPMTDKLSEELKENMKNKIPAKKFGNPIDIANCALFLASDMAEYINGQTIHVNGGMFMA